MWGRISASFLYVAQGDSSYLIYKSVLLSDGFGEKDQGKVGELGVEAKGKVTYLIFLKH